jgi:hypothetical protein
MARRVMGQWFWRSAAATSALLAVACGSDTKSASNPTATSDAVATDLATTSDASTSNSVDATATATDAITADVPAPATATALKLHIGDWTMKPKQEVTRCVIKRLDNVDPVFVHALHSKAVKGSHHLIVYRSDDTVEKPEPFDCDPFAETLSGNNIPLMISQVYEETLTLPAGVAFEFQPKQMIRLEMHFLNYFKEDVTAKADVTFDTLPPAEVKDKADMFFYGTGSFSLPPGKVTTTPWNWLPMWEGAKVFALTGHEHALGTNVEIALQSTGTDAPSQAVYPPPGKAFDWAEPPMAQFDPPLAFDKMGGLSYRCTWNNTTDKTVTFGESANQEMCFLWGYYYPSKGYRMCVNTSEIEQKYARKYGIDLGPYICCPDDALCGLLKQWLGQATSGN